jgi:hypothetical protein
MITTGAKWFYGLAAAALVAALAYGFSTQGGLSGVFTFGLLGGVGERLGMLVLLGLAATAAMLGSVVIAVRDADAEAIESLLGIEILPAAAPPSYESYWPVVAAFGVGAAMIGLVVGEVLFVVGVMAVGVAFVEWAVDAWADRATGDPEANRQIRNRIMHPIEFPVAGALAIAALVLCVSRVLLALPKEGSDAVAIAFAAVVLAVAFLFAYKPSIGRTAVGVVLALFAVAVLVGGIVAAANGSRSFEDEGGGSKQEQPTSTTPTTGQSLRLTGGRGTWQAEGA